MQTTELEPGPDSVTAATPVGMPRRSPFIPILALIVAAALGLRFTSLTGESLWLDEIFSVWMCRQSWPGWWHMMHLENHPPLYYLTLRLWMAVFGGSDFSARSLSVICGALTVVAVALTMRRIAGPRVALFAASLAAVMPQLIRYSQETRMYSMAVLLAALALGGALDWMAKGDRRSAWLYTISISLCIYTHYYGLLLWFGLTTGGGLYLLRSARPVTVMWRWLLINLIPLAAFLPWLPVLQAQLAVNWDTHWLLSIPKPDPVAPVEFIGWCFGLFTDRDGFQSPFYVLASATGVVMFLLCVAAVYGILRLPLSSADGASDPVERSDRLSRALCIGAGAGVVPACIAWLVSMAHNMWQEKYLLVCTPALIYMAATAIMGLRRRWAAALVGGTLMANCLIVALSLVGTMAPWNQEQWREAAQYLRTHVAPGDIAVVPDPTTLPPYSLCLLHYGVKSTPVMDVRADLSNPLEVQALKDACRHANRIWLVKRSHLDGQISDFLSVHGFHPGGPDAEFTRVSLQLYERTP